MFTYIRCPQFCDNNVFGDHHCYPFEVTGRGPKTGAGLVTGRVTATIDWLGGWLDVGRLGQHQSLWQRSVGEAIFDAAL